MRGVVVLRSNVYIGVIDGLLQGAERVAGGFHLGKDSIAIAYLRLPEFTHLSDRPFEASLV